MVVCGADCGDPLAVERLSPPRGDTKEGDLRLAPADLASLGEALGRRAEDAAPLGTRLKAAVSAADAAAAAAALTADKDTRRQTPASGRGRGAAAPTPRPKAALTHLATALVKQPGDVMEGGLLPSLAGATEAVAAVDASLRAVALQRSNVAVLAVALDALLAGCTLTDVEASVVDGALAAAENRSPPPPSPRRPRHHPTARASGDSQSAPSMRLTGATSFWRDDLAATTDAVDATVDDDDDDLQAVLLPAARVLAAKAAYEPTPSGVARMHAVATGRAALDNRRGRMVAVLLPALRRRADGVAAASTAAGAVVTVTAADRKWVRRDGDVPAGGRVAALPRVRTPTALASFGAAHGCLAALCPRSAAFLRRAYTGAAAKALPAALDAAAAAADVDSGAAAPERLSKVAAVKRGDSCCSATAASFVAATVTRQ